MVVTNSCIHEVSPAAVVDQQWLSRTAMLMKSHRCALNRLSRDYSGLPSKILLRLVFFRTHRGKISFCSIDGSSFVGDSFVVATSVVKKMCLSRFAGGLAALEYRIATFARDTRTATSRPVLSPMTHIAQSARDPVDCRLDTRRCNSK